MTTIIKVNHVTIGSDDIIFMAGPCSIESDQQIHDCAKQVAQAGAQILRGGAFKPRTSPHDFQGLGIEGLKMMRNAADAHQLLVISEVMDIENIEAMGEYVDIFQVGSRNMYNYPLLKQLGHQQKPVLLKRAFSATYKEFSSASEYIRKEGNDQVILCERGIRTFETETRNTLDLNAVPMLKKMTGLPVIVDPSHGTGRRDLITPMSLAGVACGADGLMIEVHPNPDASISDAAQTIDPEHFAGIVGKVRAIRSALT